MEIITMKYTKFLALCVGGKKCVCFPAPGTTERRKLHKAAKKKEKKLAMKCEEV